MAAPAKDDSVVVVETGGGETAGPSLEAAVRAERERRRTQDKPAIVITNQNLAQYAKGQLTTVAAEPAAKPATAAVAAPAHDEAYWRQGTLDRRLRWRAAADQIAARQQESEELRRRFYAEDDPYRRDTQIKPAWDFALESLASARREAELARAELETFVEEGRRAGAFPGWLREGLEEEPAVEEPPPSAVEPGEPVVVGEDDGPP